MCLKLNHLAGDGGAGKDALYLVSRHYEGGSEGALGYLTSPSSPPPRLPPPRGLEVLFRHLTLSQRLQALAHTARDGWAMISPPRYWNMATPGSREARRWARRDYLFHRFDPEETQSLRRRAKACGATLNDLFSGRLRPGASAGAFPSGAFNPPPVAHDRGSAEVPAFGPGRLPCATCRDFPI